MHLEELEKCQCCNRSEFCFHPRQSYRSFSSLKYWEKFPLWYIGRAPYIREYLLISVQYPSHSRKVGIRTLPLLHLVMCICLSSCAWHALAKSILWMFRTSTNTLKKSCIQPWNISIMVRVKVLVVYIGLIPTTHHIH